MLDSVASDVTPVVMLLSNKTRSDYGVYKLFRPYSSLLTGQQ